MASEHDNTGPKIEYKPERRKQAADFDALNREAKSLYIRYLLEAVQLGGKRELEETQEIILHLYDEASSRDRMTGLYNREGLSVRLAEAVVMSLQHNIPISVVHLDGDRFKPINDQLGHEVGNKTIKAIAKGLKTAKLRPQDIESRPSDKQEEQHEVENDSEETRTGGDEFVVVLIGADAEGAVQATKRIINSIIDVVHEDVPELRETFGPNYSFSVTAGIATFDRNRDLNPNLDPKDIDNISQAVNSLIAAADHAGIYAKDQKKAVFYRSNKHIAVAHYNPTSSVKFELQEVEGNTISPAEDELNPGEISYTFTEQELAERDAKIALDAAELVARTVSHKMGNAITPAAGYAEILSSNSELPPEQLKDLAQEIRDSTKKASEIIQQLNQIKQLVIDEKMSTSTGTVLNLEESIENPAEPTNYRKT